jgi:hypothetical protein
MIYHVIETPCFPARWKVESVRWPGHDNATLNYFRDKEKAQAECDRRNAAEGKK